MHWRDRALVLCDMECGCWPAHSRACSHPQSGATACFRPACLARSRWRARAPRVRRKRLAGARASPAERAKRSAHQAACAGARRRARVMHQRVDSDELVQEAIDTCPVTCIHWVRRRRAAPMAPRVGASPGGHGAPHVVRAVCVVPSGAAKGAVALSPLAAPRPGSSAPARRLLGAAESGQAW
jgi:hypothetical protein